MSECTAVVCKKDATMALNIRVNFTAQVYDDSLPYCDDHLGWFYRSFSRPSYETEVLGITILTSVDDQFKNWPGGT